jgi:pre-rRNA-processing protein IPI3
MLSPFPDKRMAKAGAVVKPKLGEGEYTFTAQLTGTMEVDTFNRILNAPGIPPEMLDDAISRFSRPAAASSSGDEKLRKENEELWKVINEQRALQKKTWEKYSQLKSGGA